MNRSMNHKHRGLVSKAELGSCTVESGALALVDPTAQAVWHTLLAISWADERGRWVRRISVPGLAKLVGIKARALQNHISSLVQAGLIHCERGGGRASNKYIFPIECDPGGSPQSRNSTVGPGSGAQTCAAGESDGAPRTGGVEHCASNINTESEEPSIRQMLLADLRALGVQNAETLVKHRNATTPRLEFLIETAGGMKNPAGFIVSGIRRGFLVPNGFRSNRHQEADQARRRREDDDLLAALWMLPPAEQERFAELVRGEPGGWRSPNGWRADREFTLQVARRARGAGVLPGQ